MVEEPNLAEEMEKMEGEPLLPVEKKLVAWSLIIGGLLLGMLVWLSRTYFPAAR